jgi:Domain of unknown function (DUF4440)
VILPHLLTAGYGTNATMKAREFISAYRGGADSIPTSLFSRLMTHSGHRPDRNPAAQQSSGIPRCAIFSVGGCDVGAFQALPKLTVKFGEQFIRVYGDTAVNTGYYTLSYTKDGETRSIPARYSFTFVKEGNDCKIVDHSSAMPAPPR